VKRAAKESYQRSGGPVKGKRGRKRKSPAPAGAKARKAGRNEAEVVEDEIALFRKSQFVGRQY